MRIPASVAANVKSLTLVIDKNPAPVAATFTFGKAAGDGERMLSTRVRIDMYSNVRAVIETGDGKLHMTTKFVKASGGCSAPAGKDMDEALANLGKMQIKTFAAAADRTPDTREAQVMIRHPNYTGMQMDQLTREFTPAKFVQELEVKRGGELVFRMDSGISISENPNFRFTFASSSDEHAGGDGQGHGRPRLHRDVGRQGHLSAAGRVFTQGAPRCGAPSRLRALHGYVEAGALPQVSFSGHAGGMLPA